MKNRRVWVLIFLIMVVVITGSILDDEYEKISIEDVIEKNKSHNSEFDYQDYFDIKMKETEILFDATTEGKIKDDDFCNIMYSVRIINISDDSHNFFIRYYIPNELYESIVYSSNYFGLEGESVEIESGKGYTADAGIIMKHPGKFTISDRNLYENYKDDLYVLLVVDGKKAYIKIDDLVITDW